MELLVRFEAFDTITSPSQILELRQAAGDTLEKVEKSGHLVFSRVFVGARGGIMVLDVEDSEQAFDLLSPGIVDHFHTEVRPVVTAEELGRFFQRDHARLARSAGGA